MESITREKAKSLANELYQNYEHEGCECSAYKELEQLGITEHPDFDGVIGDINQKYKDENFVSLETIAEQIYKLGKWK